MSQNQAAQFIEKIYANKSKLTTTDMRFTTIIIPSIIKNELIKTTDFKKSEYFSSIKLHPDTFFAASETFLPPNLKLFSDGLVSQKSAENRFKQISIYRNGCIHYIDDFINHHHHQYDTNGFAYIYHAVRLMQSLQFANQILRHHGYFDDVTILVVLDASSKTTIRMDYRKVDLKIDKIHCKIIRMHPLSYVESDFEKITSSIFDEIFNYCGVEDCCDIFDENGRVITERVYLTIPGKYAMTSKIF